MQIMIQNIIQNQKAELERRIRENYTPRETLLKGGNTGLVSVVIGPPVSNREQFAFA